MAPPPDGVLPYHRQDTCILHQVLRLPDSLSFYQNLLHFLPVVLFHLLAAWYFFPVYLIISLAVHSCRYYMWGS